MAKSARLRLPGKDVSSGPQGTDLTWSSLELSLFWHLLHGVSCACWCLPMSQQGQTWSSDISHSQPGFSQTPKAAAASDQEFSCGQQSSVSPQVHEELLVGWESE